MKRLFYFFCSIFLLMSCISLDVSNANLAANKNNYLESIAHLEPYFYKDLTNLDPVVLETYQKIWLQGKQYYQNAISQNLAVSNRNMLDYYEDYYILLRSYGNFSPEAKKLLPLITMKKEEIQKARIAFINSYVTYADQISDNNYRNRLHRYLLYKKANDNANPVIPNLQKKLQNASDTLEKHLEIKTLGVYDYTFQNTVYAKMKQVLSNTGLFQISNVGRKELLLEILVENYQITENQGNFSTVTEYKNKKIVLDQVIDGKIVKKEKKIQVPYQKLIFTKSSNLQYNLTYKLLDRNQNIILTRTIPAQMNDEKKWFQYVAIDPIHNISLPSNQKEPVSIPKETLISNSLADILKYLEQDVQDLKKY